MNVARSWRPAPRLASVVLAAAWFLPAVLPIAVEAQTDASAGAIAGDKPSASASASDDTEGSPDLSAAKTPAERKRAAWRMLEDAAGDQKHVPLRIQALAALGMLRSPESERMIGNALQDPDLDVRTSAVLAAGQTRDRNLTTGLRDLLDDKEPQVAFTAAMTLSRMGDRSGEDILMAVADGDRSPTPGVLHGTEHKINRELRNPAKLARLGAIQGAAMLLGPFGFGITAIEYMRQSGGDAARAAAIEQIAQQKTAPIHTMLLDALKDKDAAVRAAAAKALVGYADQPTRDAVFPLLLDPKDPVRLTAAAAYLRLAGVPGPVPPGSAAETRPRRQRVLKAGGAQGQ
jgi:HEAT repeat protein